MVLGVNMTGIFEMPVMFSTGLQGEHIVPQKSSVPSLLFEMWYGTFLDKYTRLLFADQRILIF